MKKLITVLLMAIAIDLSAQTIVIDPGNTVRVDTTGSKYPVVSQTPTSDSSAAQDTSKRITLWVEPGDGSLSTTPPVNHQILSKQAYTPLMVATNLYDTGRGGVNRIVPSRFSSTYMQRVSIPNTGAFTESINEAIGVRLQSNVKSIVPGDTMVFAITYKINRPSPAKGLLLPPENYKLYFFYNDNATFVPLSGVENIVLGMPFVRVHDTETVLPSSARPFADEVTQQKGFTNYLAFNVTASEAKLYERTIFISMIPKDTLTYGESGSVYAVLTDAGGNRKATDSIGKMMFAPAHDPNYLVQSPTCLELPKHTVPLSYHIHFQNTGEGPAKEVRLRIQLPHAMDWSTFKLENALYAGMNFPVRSLITIPADPRTNKTDSLVVIFRSTNYLRGRDADNPATNPQTMGDVFFSVTATPQVKDSMQAYANIDFLSVHSTRPPGEYEDPVRTNTATTVYKEHCTDCGCVPCYKILGLCWWWWLIILAIIIIIIIIIKRRRKKLQAC